MTKTILACDICNTTSVLGEGTSSWVAIISANDHTVTFIPANDSIGRKGKILHLCGSQCASKWVTGIVDGIQQQQANKSRGEAA